MFIWFVWFVGFVWFIWFIWLITNSGQRTSGNEQGFYGISGTDYCTEGVLGREGLCNPAAL